MREDEYIKQFEGGDRPILLIKNKEEFKNLNPKAQNKDDDYYVKMTENTQIVKDIRNQILSQSSFIRRETQVHQAKKSSDDKFHFYKIEGIEFLPEGFLELDPLLFHDEYEFESELQKELFNLDQRKLKAKRRKQYEQRNNNKMREVTLYIGDERQEMIIQFLEKWYFKKKRRMTEEELTMAAEEIKVDFETMKSLQENYLEHKKLINTKDLHEYLLSNDRIKNGDVNFPISLSKYFVKSKNHYEDVKSRVYETKGIYNPFKINEWEKRVNAKKSQSRKKKANFTQKVFNGFDSLDKSLQQNQTQKVTEESKKDDFRSLKGSLTYNNMSFSPEQSQKYKELKNSIGENQELQAYFDMEVNKILSKISKAQTSNQQQEYYDSEKKVSVLQQKPDVAPEALPEHPAQRYSKKEQSISNSELANKGSPVYYQVNKQGSLSQKMHEENQDVRFPTQIHKGESKKPSLVPKKSQPNNEPQKKNLQKKNLNKKAPKSQSLSQKQENVDVKKRLTDLIGVVSRPSNLKRFSLTYKKENGDTVVIQKLGPVLIGTDYYFQSIEECIPADGSEPSIQLITRDEQRIIVHRENIDMEKLGAFYQNKVISEPQSQIAENKFLLVLQNDRNQTISAQQINEKLPYKISNADSSRISLLGKTSVARDGNKSFHVLQPITIGNLYYQQVVNETLKDADSKQIEVITHDENGNVISRDFIEGDFGDRFTTIIQKDCIDTKNQRETVIQTIDDKGNKLAEHKISIAIPTLPDQKNLESFQKGRISTIKQKGQMIKAYSIAPVKVGTQFIKQKLYESFGWGAAKGKRLVTFDAKGNVVADELIETPDEGNNYISVLLEEKEENGRTTLSIATKNDLNQTIAVQKITSRSYSTLAEEMYNQFIQQANGRSSISNNNPRQSKKVSFALRPTFYLNQFYQQFIEEDESKKVSIITKDENGQVISKQSLTAQDLENKEFFTQISEIEGDSNNLKVITQDDEGRILMEQEIEAQLNEGLNDNYVAQFDQQADGRVVLIQSHENNGNKIVCYLNRPCKIQGLIYQQIILEITDEFSDKERLLILKSNKGEVLDVKNISSQTHLDEELTQKYTQENGRVLLAVFNGNNEKVGEQTIQLAEKEQKQRNNSIVFSKKNSQGQIRHTMFLKQQGLEHYELIVEEVLGKYGLTELSIEKTESDDVERKKAESVFKSKSYSARVAGSFLDKTNQRKATVEIVNDRDQVLGSFILNYLQDEYYNENVLFDDEPIENTKKLSVSKSTTNRGTVTVKKLRPTQIATKIYESYFEELEGRDGQKKLTLVIRDGNNKEIVKQEINPSMITEDYESTLEKQTDDKNIQKYILQFKNQKKQLLFKKEFPSDSQQTQEEKFDSVEGLYDSKGKRCGTVFSQQNRKSTTNTFKLRPTHIGSQFYQSTIEQMIEEGVTKKCTFILSNENGEVAAVKEVELGKVGDKYYQEVREEIIVGGKNRQMTIVIKNERDEVVLEEKIDLELTEDVDPLNVNSNIFEEVIEGNESKKVSVYTSRNQSLLMDMSQIQQEQSGNEQDPNSSIASKIQKLDNLIEQFGQKSDLSRFSYNQVKEKVDRNNTYDAPQKENDKNKPQERFESFGEVTEKKAPTFSKEGSFDVKRKSSTKNQYMNSNEESIKKSKRSTTEEDLSKKVSSMLIKDKEQWVKELLENLGKDESRWPYNTIGEFKEFCRVYLPYDENYKESVMLISLFYYYMKKKNLKISN